MLGATLCAGAMEGLHAHARVAVHLHLQRLGCLGKSVWKVALRPVYSRISSGRVFLVGAVGSSG